MRRRANTGHPALHRGLTQPDPTKLSQKPTVKVTLVATVIILPLQSLCKLKRLELFKETNICPSNSVREQQTRFWDQSTFSALHSTMKSSTYFQTTYLQYLDNHVENEIAAEFSAKDRI